MIMRIIRSGRIGSFPVTHGGQVYQSPTLGGLNEWSIPVASGSFRRKQNLNASHLKAQIYPSPKEIFVTGTWASVEINSDVASFSATVGIDLGNPLYDASAATKEIPAIKGASAGVREDPLY